MQELACRTCTWRPGETSKVDETVVNPSFPVTLTPARRVSRQLLCFFERNLGGPSTVVLGYLIVLAARCSSYPVPAADRTRESYAQSGSNGRFCAACGCWLHEPSFCSRSSETTERYGPSAIPSGSERWCFSLVIVIRSANTSRCPSVSYSSSSHAHTSDALGAFSSH